MSKPRTPAQVAASRQNGKSGGRPQSDEGDKELRRRREQARAEGREAALENPRFWSHVRDSSRYSMESRMRAAQELEDRYGFPKQQVIGTASLDDAAARKLFDWGAGGEFKAPDSWAETPPPSSTH